MFAAISDVWSMKAFEMCVKWLPIAVEDPSNREARAQMLLGTPLANMLV